MLENWGEALAKFSLILPLYNNNFTKNSIIMASKREIEPLNLDYKTNFLRNEGEPS